MQVMAALFYFLLSSSPAGQKWSIERKFLFLVFFFSFYFSFSFFSGVFWLLMATGCVGK